MNHSRLEQEKRLLIRQCEVDRQKLYDRFEELEMRTTWARMAIAGAGLILPKLKFLLPVAGFILPKLLTRKSSGETAAGFRNALGVTWDMARKLMVVGKGLKVLPSLLPRKSS